MLDQHLLSGQTLRISGRDVHLHRRGRGRPVLLLHGNGSLGQEILSLCPDLPGIEWIAPDRPGYGRSDAPAAWDPVAGADWIAELTATLDLKRVTLVAHSIAAGQAIICAARHPGLVRGLVLLAPFCRPTPHRWKPLLRLAARPVIGAPLRYGVVPLVTGLFPRPILRALLSRPTLPPWFRSFPLAAAASGSALTATAAELRAFNTGMRAVERGLCVTVPTRVIWGSEDQTAERSWHLPWLRARILGARIDLAQGAGHLVHHEAPVLTLSRIVELTLRVPPGT